MSAEPLDPTSAFAAVVDPAAGAIATFVGTVRETAAASEANGSPVVRLEYDSHPLLTEQKLREIAAAASERWNLTKVVAIHRSGVCDLGEPTVVVACSAPHRAPALEACRWIIDSIKSDVPIWKREVYATGASWITAEASP